MLHFRLLEILDKQEKSRYWLRVQMKMSCKNFNKLIQNDTSSVRFDTIERLCSILECMPGDLFAFEREKMSNNRK